MKIRRLNFYPDNPAGGIEIGSDVTWEMTEASASQLISNSFPSNPLVNVNLSRLSIENNAVNGDLLIEGCSFSSVHISADTLNVNIEELEMLGGEGLGIFATVANLDLSNVVIENSIVEEEGSALSVTAETMNGAVANTEVSGSTGDAVSFTMLATASNSNLLISHSLIADNLGSGVVVMGSLDDALLEIGNPILFSHATKTLRLVPRYHSK